MNRTMSSCYFACSCCLLMALAGPGLAHVVLLPLGDSITQAEYHSGIPDQQRPSYRDPLQTLLTNAGIGFDFVGSHTDYCQSGPLPPPVGFPSAGFDPDHEGHWGWTADEIVDGGPVISSCAGGTAGSGKLSDWIPNYPAIPDLVLLHIGTNDIIQGLPPGHTTGVQDLTPAQIAEIKSDIESIITTLKTISNPNLTILLANLIPGTLIDLEVQAVNAEIAMIALADPMVTLVDQYSGFDANTSTYDGVHPNMAGEMHMADRWFTAIQQVTVPEPGAWVCCGMLAFFAAVKKVRLGDRK